MNRQRIIAFSAGTQEFWVVHPERRTLQVTTRAGVATFTEADVIPVVAIPVVAIPVVAIPGTKIVV